MEEINNILNDEKYVALINKLSSLIYQYALLSKGNFQEIRNNFVLLVDKLKQNNIIKNFLLLSNSNEDNLNKFFSDAQFIFKNLKIERKEYLQNLLNFIKKNKLTEKAFKPEYKRYHSQNKITNDKQNNQNTLSSIQIILNLLLKLTQYSDMIETYSEQEKNNYENIINIIFKEIKKFQKYFENQNNNYNNNFNNINKEKIIEKNENEIQNYKIKIYNLKNYISNLEKK